MIQHLMVAVKSAPHFSCSLHQIQREQMLGKVKNKVNFFKVFKEWTKIKNQKCVVSIQHIFY